MTMNCTHLGEARVLQTDKDYCEECVLSEQRWVHLRLCLTCGHVGCCDSSTNRHASKHYQETGHPLVRSIEPGEHWVWCYEDKIVAGEIDQ
ncbi:UBP-type zinc finger domain-containing protein [Paraburkholderia sediminicola]|uniref:UBP-type zinc finger domain-containing protein n=1 Tax=Paraburkholderia sediminicola TaxID=458836 RepID=UPI0038BC93CF